MVEIFDNIRKLYRFHAPGEELTGWIEFFSESSAEETKRHITGELFTIRLFPSWTPTIWFNLGSPYKLVNGTYVHHVQADDDVLILRDTIAERRNLPSDHIFTVKFFPGGLDKILGIPQAALAQQVIDLKNILPVSLIGAVRQAHSFEQRVKVLEDFFIISAGKKKRKDHRFNIVKEAIETFAHSGHQFKNVEIAAKTFTTSKTINRYFHSVIGTGPKQYFATLRIRNGLTAYLFDRKQFMPDDYGYYDWSHFYRDVFKFTGQGLNAH